MKIASWNIWLDAGRKKGSDKPPYRLEAICAKLQLVSADIVRVEEIMTGDGWVLVCKENVEKLGFGCIDAVFFCNEYSEISEMLN